MQLNLNDPDSIVAWWRVYPEQHDAYLDYKVKASPEFAPSILEAQRRIAVDPALSSLRVSDRPQRWRMAADAWTAAEEAEQENLVAA